MFTTILHSRDLPRLIGLTCRAYSVPTYTSPRFGLLAHPSSRSRTDAEQPERQTEEKVKHTHQRSARPSSQTSTGDVRPHKKTEGKVKRNELYISNIHPESKAPDLMKAFSSFGLVKEAIIVPGLNSPNSRGYGFVTFHKPESAANALNASVILHGHTLTISRSRETPSTTLPTSWEEILPSKKLLVQNVHHETTEEELIKAFSAFGPIRYVTVNPRSYKTKTRSAVVVFKKLADAMKVQNSDPVRVHGRLLSTEYGRSEKPPDRVATRTLESSSINHTFRSGSGYSQRRGASSEDGRDSSRPVSAYRK